MGNIATCIEGEIRRFCEADTWEIGALHMQEDHVYLFLNAPPAIAPSLIAHTLKGITARQVFKQYPDVKKHLWGGSFWARSYSIGTVDDMTEKTVKTYIALRQGT